MLRTSGPKGFSCTGVYTVYCPPVAAGVRAGRGNEGLGWDLMPKWQELEGIWWGATVCLCPSGGTPMAWAIFWLRAKLAFYLSEGSPRRGQAPSIIQARCARPIGSILEKWAARPKSYNNCEHSCCAYLPPPVTVKQELSKIKRSKCYILTNFTRINKVNRHWKTSIEFGKQYAHKLIQQYSLLNLYKKIWKLP